MRYGEYDVKKECAWVIGNLVDEGRYEQVVFAAKGGCWCQPVFLNPFLEKCVSLASAFVGKNFSIRLHFRTPHQKVRLPSLGQRADAERGCTQ